jgi:predicted Holliday junction resolvase-like endonuclease
MENLNSNYYLSTSLLPFILILFVFFLQIISAVYSVKELKNQFGANEKSAGSNLNRNTTKKLQVDPYERLNKLKELLDSNTITDDEFQIEKAKILRSI